MSAPASPVTTRGRIEELVDRARQDSGLEHFGADTWREGLEVLVGSALTEARLTAFGEDMFYGGLVRTLANRARIEDWFARHPEIGEQEVVVELLGVGFPRTGSTALSHLMAEDDSVRVLRTWEAPAPCPPPGLDPAADAERVAGAEAMVAMTLEALPQFATLLPQSATGPIEDHDMWAYDFKGQVYLTQATLPSYVEWYLACDMEETYRYERRVLQLLQWRTGTRPWQLKSPTHSLFLADVEKVFPEARFVMTHRDVAKVLPSVTDLYCTLLTMTSEVVDRHAVGQLNVQQWGLALDRFLEFRQDPARDAKFHDLGFNAFQADPVGEIRRLHTWLGRDLSAEAEQRMVAWREANPRDKHGVHTYDAADFGLGEDVLGPRFAAYRERFAAYL